MLSALLRTRLLSAMACVLLLSACSPSGSQKSGLTISGSTSVSPYVEHLAELYQHDHAGQSVNIQSLGSSAGIQAAISGVAEIGMSSRDLKKEEAEKLDELVIARDALAVILHPRNPVAGLKQEQIQDIFGGKITNWRDVGGPDARISVVVREAGSGTFTAFEELVLKGKPVTPAALRQGSNGAVRQVVAEDPNAIGYISLGIVDQSVKAINVNDVRPTHENGVAGKYKFVRRFLFVWQKGATLSPLAKQYTDFVMSETGQAEFDKLGLVRVQ
jgi:phosphate transport system substrate-binding protein